jgi:hypothetical protein
MVRTIKPQLGLGARSGQAGDSEANFLVEVRARVRGRDHPAHASTGRDDVKILKNIQGRRRKAA